MVVHRAAPDRCSLGLPNNPERIRKSGELREPGTVEDWERFEHRYDLDQPGALDIQRRWRRIAEEYGALLLGEVYLLHGNQLARYLTAGDGLHAAFWVQLLALGWDPPAQLVATTSLPLASIAERCGFGSAETLRQAFVSRYGVPPAQYRALQAKAFGST